MKRLLPSLILTVPFFIGCPGGESSDDSAAALLLLGAGESVEPTICSWTTAAGPSTVTLSLPLVTVRGSGSASVPTVAASGSGAHWVAFRFPAVKAGTVISFNFNPKYTHQTDLDGYAVLNCPIDTVNAPTTATFTSFTGTYAGTSTVNITAPGDVIFIGGPTADPTGGTVTRNDP